MPAVPDLPDRDSEEEGARRARPARPVEQTTESGQPVREVRSYARRGSRLSSGQARAWAERSAAWVIPNEAATAAGFDLAEWFERRGPLIVEIGSGIGEATVTLAAARPAYDVLALEVWHPGVASTLGLLAEHGVGNVRLCAVDAVWFLRERVPEEGLAELWTFFPDPWPKKRHHKRRLVNPHFAALVASRLAMGGVWRLATDWPDYAARMLEVIEAQPGLTGGVVDRWAERPVTRFERRGLAEGRPITDLLVERVR